MSSETSTESFQPWQLFTLAGLIGATIVVFMSRGQSPAAIILLSLTIFTAAALGVAAWRTLAPFTGTEDLGMPQVVGGRTRAGLEREKALVLRAIKDLEFDRAMGKVSDKDFAEMSTRLRSRAARLMRQLDAGAGYREQIEKEIEARVHRGPQGSAPQSMGGSAPQTMAGALPQTHAARAFTAREESADAARTLAVRVCGACQVENDPDAKFCKNCGTNLGASA